MRFRIDWTAVAIALAAGLLSAATVIWAEGMRVGAVETRIESLEKHASDQNLHMTADVHRRLGRIEGYLAGIADHLGVPPPKDK